MPRFNRHDICLAWYMYASHYHGGQFSRLYRVFGRLGRINFQSFIGGGTERYFAREANANEEQVYSEYENARAIYESLVERKVHQ